MAHRLKVLECIRQGLIGGGESHLLVLMENIDRAKYDPVVLSFTGGPMIDRLDQMGVKNYIIPSLRAFDVKVWGKVKKLMIKERIELVHVHGSRANSNILWAARSLKIPVIYTVHGWSFHQDQHFLVRNLRVMGEKYLTSRTTMNISVSESNKQSGRQFIKGFDSVVVNNGIDQARFDPSRPYKDIRREFGIPANKVLVLFLARFTAHKQPLALIKAFTGAVKRNKQLHLMMVGDGDQKQEAIGLINKEGTGDHITLVPFRLDVPDIIACADIYVLPSLWEGLPIALLEAMAMGKAVIGTKVDGTSEVIQDRENGLLIPTENLVKELEEKLVELSQDESMRRALQEKAIATVNEKYNAVNMTRRIEGLYEQVMAK